MASLYRLESLWVDLRATSSDFAHGLVAATSRNICRRISGGSLAREEVEDIADMCNFA
jgi:hypothetical protein